MLCCHLVSKNETSAARMCSKPVSSWSVVHSYSFIDVTGAFYTVAVVQLSRLTKVVSTLSIKKPSNIRDRWSFRTLGLYNFKIICLCIIRKPLRAFITISARNHLCRSRYMLYRPSVYPSLSVCPSIRPSHGWISQKRLKLGSCNFHHRVAQSL